MSIQDYPIFDCKSPQDVRQAVKEHKIKFIQFWFVDVLGTIKNFQVMPDELEEAFSEGMGFDGSSIEGFSRIHESDMVAIPDPSLLFFGFAAFIPEPGKWSTIPRCLPGLLT